MEDALEMLKRVGLTEYEARAYLALLGRHAEGAAGLSKGSGVPRTKIYSVLESLAGKGWIKVHSGYPLLFKAVHPRKVFERMKADHHAFLESVSTKLDEEMNVMEKYVISNYNIGLENLKKELGKARTVWISNATADLLKRLKGSFGERAQVRIVLFPGEERPKDEDFECREAALRVVQMVKGREAPASSIILDEERTFTAFKDPTTDNYVISEMLYDDCTNCFRDWYRLGWGD